MSLKLDRSRWTRVTFGDFVRNVNDYFDPARDGALPYVAGPHIDAGIVTPRAYGSTEDDDFPPTFKRRFQPNDVLLHSRGIEKLAVVDRCGVTGEKLFVLRSIDGSKLEQSFLVWLLLSAAAQSHMQANFTGSVNKFLNWKPLAGMEFDLPPLDEQQRLATLLWTFERCRRALARRVGALEVVADQLFSSYLQSATAVQVPLPKLVPEMTVGVVVRPTQYYTDEPHGVAALRGLNIRPGGFDLEDLVRFRPESAAELAKSTLNLGDVVIVRTGRPGDAAVVTSETAGFNCIDLIIARPGKDILPEFFALLLNSTYGRDQIARLSAGTAQQHFNVGALKKLMLPNIDIDIQKDLVAQVDAARDAQRVSTEELDRLDTLRSSILTEIFGGN